MTQPLQPEALAASGRGAAGISAAAEEKEDEDAECTICFEALSTVGGAIPLPCACRVLYCSGCWDRALAASMSCTGRGLCPSCRGAMRVSFDAESGRLSFARALPLESGEDNWRKRLYEEAKPLQIRLLRQFGGQAAAPAGGLASGGEGSGEGGASSSAARAGGDDAAPQEPPVFTPAPPEDGLEPPRCVCGSRLVRSSVRDRVLAFIAEETPILPPPSLVEQLMNAPPINCDICRRQLDGGGNVWTCENGRRTVLHAVAYDVCESCFALHAHGIQGPPSGGGRGGSDGEDSDYWSDEDSEWDDG